MIDWKCYEFDSVSSTNDIAREYPEGACIRADVQTKGRGRSSRIWVSEKGNLFSSFVVSRKNISGLTSLAMALAVRKTFIELGVKSEDVCLKWPNDVLIRHKKASGILIECSETGIIGIGLNLISSPKKEMLYPVTSVKEEINQEIPCRQALDILKRNVSFYLTQNNTTDEFMKASFPKGTSLRFHTPQGLVCGEYAGIAPDGAVQLRIEGNVKTFYAGDVLPSHS